MSATSSRNGPIPAAAGIGLRFPHHERILRERPRIAWLEVHAENYFGGPARRTLDAVRREYPIALHGVGLSLGSAEGLDPRHLRRLADLARGIEPCAVSEHLSWSVAGGHYLADLLPLPLTEEALAVVCRHVSETQEVLQRRILLENPSTYLRFPHSTIPECEFLAEVSERTGCGILCDVNNVFVSAANHGWSARAYLEALPSRAVAEIHLAGHAVRRLDDGREVRIDDHGSRVCEDVWALYRLALARFGTVATLIEWDTDIPPLEVLLEEAARAEALMADASTAEALTAEALMTAGRVHADVA